MSAEEQGTSAFFVHGMPIEDVCLKAFLPVSDVAGRVRGIDYIIKPSSFHRSRLDLD